MPEDDRFDSQSAYTNANSQQNSQKARSNGAQCPSCGLVVGADTAFCPNDATPIKGFQTGRNITNYQLIRLIGEGGMANVYEAEHVVLKKRVALKILKAHLMETSALMRFQQEAQTASRLNHPNVVAVYDCGISEKGEPYMVMDLVHGLTLDAMLERGPLSIEESLDIIKQIAAGVAAAHEKGILHRDLKPSNVILESNGKNTIARVLDFGIAKIMQEVDHSAMKTKTGEIFGTPTYMSPEQISGETLDQRSDIFAVGCIFYEMLTGQPPVVGKTLMEVMYKQVNSEPLSLADASFGRKFPNQLEKIVSRSIAKHASDRFATLSQMLAAIDNFEAGKTEVANPAVRHDLNQPKKSKLSFYSIAALIVFLLGLCAATIIGVMKSDEPEKHSVVVTIPTHESNHPEEQSLTDQIYSSQLRKSGNVQSLTVPPDVSDAPLVNIELFKLLRELKLRGCLKLSTKCLGYISSLPVLNILDISDTNLASKDGMQQISKLQHLTRLDISEMQTLPDAVMSELKGLQQLKEISIKNTDVSDHALLGIAKFKNLVKIELDRCINITNLGVAGLATLPALKQIKLNHCSHIDENVGKELCKFKNLNYIELADTKASDKTLASLSKIPHLLHLDVTKCAAVSKDGVERFKNSNHTCNIKSSDENGKVDQSNPRYLSLP